MQYSITENKRKKTSDILLIVLHIAMGFLVYTANSISLLVNILLVIISFIYIIISKDKIKAILISCAYMSMFDVFFRMTDGLVFYELNKYLLIVYSIIGLFYISFRIKGWVYIVYILLLLVTIFLSEYNLNDSVRKLIAFNLGGPISLGVFALFCYNLKVTNQELYRIFFWAALPVISLATYLFFYTPDIKEVVTGTGSNFATSGGFGPNQVATILGMGIFVFYIRVLVGKESIFRTLLESALLAFITFRGIVTFSRGGIWTAFIAIALFTLIIYFRGKSRLKIHIVKMLIITGVLGITVWMKALNDTSGLIENRYKNENALGEEKDDISTGRVDIIFVEIEAFKENPVFGIGVGKGKSFRYEKTGVTAASHNEITRLLAEHGMLGGIAFAILLLTPFVYRIQNKNNIYFYSLFIFWILTISHSAMRIAFPSFVYGLCLLNITHSKEKANSMTKIN